MDQKEETGWEGHGINLAVMLRELFVNSNLREFAKGLHFSMIVQVFQRCVIETLSEYGTQCEIIAGKKVE